MAEALIFPDPLELIISEIVSDSEFADVVISVDPRPDDFKGLYVHVRDAGGPGDWQHAFEDTRVSVEVSHPDSVEASRVIRRIDQIIRSFHTGEGLWLDTVTRPYYSPDPDMRVPAYMMTHTIRVRGIEVAAG